MSEPFNNPVMAWAMAIGIVGSILISLFIAVVLAYRMVMDDAGDRELKRLRKRVAELEGRAK